MAKGACWYDTIIAPDVEMQHMKMSPHGIPISGNECAVIFFAFFHKSLPANMQIKKLFTFKNLATHTL